MIMKLRGSLFPVALPGSVFVSPLPSGLAWTHKVLTSTWEPRSVSMPALSQQQPAGTRPGIISTWLQVVLGEVEVWTFVATLNFSWSLRQVFIRNESKPSWFHWACLQKKADAHRSLLGQTKGSPNAAQRTKVCRCSNECSGISNKLCLLETLTNMHLATASLTSGEKCNSWKDDNIFFPSLPDIALSFPVVALGDVTCTVPLPLPLCPWETLPWLCTVQTGKKLSHSPRGGCEAWWITICCILYVSRATDRHTRECTRHIHS